MNKQKIVLIGAGAVGTAFMYSAINQKLASNYVIIDLNQQIAEGHVLDFEDSAPSLGKDVTFKVGTYADLKDADVLVITAGRAQKPNETRLEMIADNAKIIESIATLAKKNGFTGVAIIASNPVDIMTQIFQKITGINSRKVISSGTWLDTIRLRVELAKKFNAKPSDVNVYLLGEHGDSSVPTITNGTIKGKKITELMEENAVTQEQIDKIIYFSSHKAYEIIDKKGATWYGIGSSLAKISKAILTEKEIKIPVGVMLSGEYGQEGTYASVLSIIGKDGVISTEEFPLSDNEKKLFNESIKILKKAIKNALIAIK